MITLKQINASRTVYFETREAALKVTNGWKAGTYEVRLMPNNKFAIAILGDEGEFEGFI